MSTNEHDIEYGPNPPGAQYEHTDIDTSIGYKFGAWLVVAMLLSAGLVYGIFWFYEGRTTARNKAAAKYPLSAGQVKEPSGPRLQTQPFKDVYLLRKSEAERLESYGWVDQPAGVTRISNRPGDGPGDRATCNS